MPTSYPGALDTVSNLPTNFVDATASASAHAAAHNNVDAAVLAIQAELGTNPRGASGTVAARLDAMPGLINLAGTLTNRPVTPTPNVAGITYFQTDGDGGIWRWSGSVWQLLGAGFNQGVPTGTVVASLSPIAPAGYLPLDGLGGNGGGGYSRTTYQRLWDLIRTDFSGSLQSTAQIQPSVCNGNGSTTFFCPDVLGRGIMNLNQYSGSAAGANTNDRDTRMTTRGQILGERLHALTVAEMAAHDHTPYTVSGGNPAYAANTLYGGTDAQGYHSHNLSINGVGDHSHATQTYIVSNGTIVQGGGAGSNRYNNTNLGSGTNGAGAHSHSGSADAAGTHSHNASVTIYAQGGNASHENVPPSVGFHFYVKY